MELRSDMGIEDEIDSFKQRLDTEIATLETKIEKLRLVRTKLCGNGADATAADIVDRTTQVIGPRNHKLVWARKTRKTKYIKRGFHEKKLRKLIVGQIYTEDEVERVCYGDDGEMRKTHSRGGQICTGMVTKGLMAKEGSGLYRYLGGVSASELARASGRRKRKR